MRVKTGMRIEGERILQNPNVLRLLEQISKKATEIRPSIDPFQELMIRYHEAEKFLPSEQTIEVLESLADEGYLMRILFDSVLKCSECGSTKLKFRMLCPRCGSPDMRRREVLEHLPCGYSGPGDEFAVKGKHVCPKCGKELKSIGVDYTKLGPLYVCRECKERFGEFKQIWLCLGCSKSFSTSELDRVNVYCYRFNPEKRSQLIIQLRPKRKVERILEKGGYKVQSNLRLKGDSGVEHFVDILASDGKHSKKMVISFCEEARLQEVVGLHAIAEDLSSRALLITMKNPDEKIKKFAERLKINILSEKELKSLV